MKRSTIPRIAVPLACLLVASAAAAETVYKYRRADGQVLYSNRPVRGVELIETFDYRIPAAPVSVSAGAAVNAAEADARIKQYLASLDAAWRDVQDAGRALAAAEEKLRKGEEPLAEEVRALSGPATPDEVTIGGPQPPAASAVGGPLPAAPAAVGGPLGTRRSGGRSPEYAARLQALENQVQVARERLETALRNYNQLR
jgi:hypothetical protein